jgi:DHA1 family multidrug resistance protein-like MFS transporter
VLAGGVSVACLGYLGLAARPPFELQLAWAAAVGIGTAATSLLGKAMLAEAAPERRPQAFALRAVAVNGGASIGPVVGAVLFGWFEVALVVTAGVYAGFLFAVVRKVPGRDPDMDPGPPPGQQLRALFGNRALVGLTVVSIGFWYLYTQLTFTFPLYANDRFGLAGRAGVFFAVEALVTVVLQYPVVAWLTGRLDGWRIVALGCAGLAAAFLLLGASPQVWGLLLFVVTFAVGALLVIPTLDVLASDLSPQRTLAGSLGVVSLGWAVGGLLGNVLGGVGYELAHESGSYLPFWMVNASIGLAVAAVFMVLRRRWPHRSPVAARTAEGETDDHQAR